MKNYSFSGAKRVCHEHFEEFCFDYKQDLDLGGLNTRNIVQCIQYLILSLHTAMFNKREKKGPGSAQKRSQDMLHTVVGRQFLFRGYNKMAMQGREIKVQFTFVMDKFVSNPLIC